MNVAEVLAKLVSRGMPEHEARAAFDALHLEVVAFEAHSAAESARYTAKDVSLGDRCFLATAQQYGLGWTSDRELPALLLVKLPFLRFFR